LLNLILFFGVLYYLLKKPISEFFSSRSLKIKNEIDKATEIIDDAQKTYDENSQKIDLIESELTELRNSIDSVTNKKISKIIENAHLMIDKIKNDTTDIIKLESIKLTNDIHIEVLNKSIEFTRYELMSDIDETKDTMLISSFFEEVKQNVISNN
ncbi:MAG TPA: hypothetical protein EYO89_00560, partial [Candidatus Dadabacteria bacterium]|nr:hypothetical protein [Candidatus Dadabacteria bacterium]